MQGAFSALLTSVAGHYAHLSPSDVGIGINGGRLVVSDVQLRPESLESPALPFRIVSGRAGLLRVKVPWGALSRSPVSFYLENVVLVAEPRSKSTETKNASFQLSKELHEQQKWHQTRIGRLLFNTHVEILDLKIEYRDVECVARIEAASLRAYSTNESWEPEFVPLDCNEGTVVMRKLFAVERLRCNMGPEFQSNDTELENCFEYTEPLIEQVDASVKVLIYAGEHNTQTESIEGIHTEVKFVLDKPAINFSKRQGNWIQSIFQNASKTGADNLNNESSQGCNRKEIKPNNKELVSPSALDSEEPSESDKSSSHEIFYEENSNRIIETQSSNYRELKELNPETHRGSNHGLEDRKSPSSSFSLWNAIVEENSDETVDDAAFALGLSSALEEIENTPAESEEDTCWQYEVRESSKVKTCNDIAFAQKAVQKAALSGGMTFRLCFQTPEHKSKHAAKIFEKNSGVSVNSKKFDEEYEMLKINSMERAEKAENEVAMLRERNRVLQLELNELEIMASKSADNKDSIIRDTERKLREAEKKIEDLARQRKFSAGEEGLLERTNSAKHNVNMGNATLKPNTNQNSGSSPIPESSSESSLTLNEWTKNSNGGAAISQEVLGEFSELKEINESTELSLNQDHHSDLTDVPLRSPQLIQNGKISHKHEVEERFARSELTDSPLKVEKIHVSYEKDGLTLI